MRNPRFQSTGFNPYIRYLMLAGCCLITAVSCQQSPEKKSEESQEPTAETAASAMPEIRPIAHATAVLTWGDQVLYVDPVGGPEPFAGQPAPNLILVTDIHGDHFNVETLEALAAEGVRILAPPAVASQMPESLAERTTTIANGESLESSGISVTAIPMYNLREEALGFHEKGRGNGYVLERDNIRVYISGDTEDIPEMRALKEIDIALVCMNLPYTMTVESAADAVLEFQPRHVYPYHFRGNPEVSDVDQFQALVLAGNPEIEVVRLDWYPDQPY